jgi:hypothetical protein
MHGGHAATQGGDRGTQSRGPRIAAVSHQVSANGGHQGLRFPVKSPGVELRHAGARMDGPETLGLTSIQTQGSAQWHDLREFSYTAFPNAHARRAEQVSGDGERAHARGSADNNNESVERSKQARHAHASKCWNAVLWRGAARSAESVRGRFGVPSKSGISASGDAADPGHGSIWPRGARSQRAQQRAQPSTARRPRHTKHVLQTEQSNAASSEPGLVLSTINYRLSTIDYRPPAMDRLCTTDGERQGVRRV